MPSTSSFSENVDPGTTIQPSESVCFDQFTFFPKLPSELRLKIWQLALPRGFSENGVRVLCVEAVPQCLVAAQPAICKFLLVTAQQRMARNDMGCYPPDALRPGEALAKIRMESEADGADLMDVRLLKVCYESRGVFTHAFPYSILVDATEHGHIRFNHQTILNVTNIVSEDIQDWILKAKDMKYELPSFKEVRCLAVDKTFKAVMPYMSALGLTLFGGLECLKVSTIPFTRLGKSCDICRSQWAPLRVRHVDNVMAHQRRIDALLAAFASDISFDFKLPKVEYSQH